MIDYYKSKIWTYSFVPEEYVHILSSITAILLNELYEEYRLLRSCGTFCWIRIGIKFMYAVFKQPFQIFLKPGDILAFSFRFLDKKQCSFWIIHTFKSLSDGFSCLICNSYFIDTSVISRWKLRNTIGILPYHFCDCFLSYRDAETIRQQSTNPKTTNADRIIIFPIIYILLSVNYSYSMINQLIDISVRKKQHIYAAFSFFL